MPESNESTSETGPAFSLAAIKNRLAGESGWSAEKVLRFDLFCRNLGKVIPGGDRHPVEMIRNPYELIMQFEQSEGVCS